MKKRLLILTVCFLLSSMIFISVPFSNNSINNMVLNFTLPKSLTIIEASAFEGTSAMVIILPETLITVGDRAFADSYALQKVIIPQAVQEIDDQAFAGILNLTVYGVKESVAAIWAQEHDVAFISINHISPWINIIKLLRNVQIAVAVPVVFACSEMLLVWRKRAQFYLASMRPQDRPELYPIDYRFP